MAKGKKSARDRAEAIAGTSDSEVRASEKAALRQLARLEKQLEGARATEVRRLAQLTAARQVGRKVTKRTRQLETATSEVAEVAQRAAELAGRIGAPAAGAARTVGGAAAHALGGAVDVVEEVAGQAGSAVSQAAGMA